MALKFHWPIRTQDTNSVRLAERVKMANSGAKYSAVANKFGVKWTKRISKGCAKSFVEKGNVFLCQQTGHGKIVYYQLFSMALGKENFALFLCLLSIMEEQVTHLNTSCTHTSCHLNSHGIPAVMLGKCTVDDRKAKEGAFVYMYASPGLLLTSTKWWSVLKSLREKIELLALIVDEAHLVIGW